MGGDRLFPSIKSAMFYGHSAAADFEGATQGRLRFRQAPDADITLLLAPRKSVKFR